MRGRFVINLFISQFINSTGHLYANVQEYIREILPLASLVQSFNGNFVYQVPLSGLQVSKLFLLLEDKRDELQIAGSYFNLFIR